MVVLGIDPGTAILGYGVVALEGDSLSALDFGVLTTPSSLPLTSRLLTLFDGLTEVISRNNPSEVAVEQLFFARNVQSALAVGHARGVALLSAARHCLPVSEYTPQQVKQAVAGYGRATKMQVQSMVQIMLSLQSIPQPDDAADALAIAICHARWNELTGGGRVVL
ncbi:MAG TPA: crossover junction endodeoxyribonuclease RuvC [Chloroflexota bacterium]|nr:crossover junction endodeoxyribonuclease RuvC [Chloroflexota bacterium]